MQATKPTIRVQGHGNVSTAPDVVVLTLKITCEDRDYGKVLAGLNRRLDALRSAVAEAGQDINALKTTSFRVEIKNDYVKAEDRYVFAGFCGDHHLELRFPFDHARFSKVFSAISACTAEPQLSIFFTVSDPEAIRQRGLEDAVKNARRRAEIIAAAAHHKLGTIVAAEYGDRESRVSSMEYDMSTSPGAPTGAPEIEPSDIESTATVQISWEITRDDATNEV